MSRQKSTYEILTNYVLAHNKHAFLCRSYVYDFESFDIIIGTNWFFSLCHAKLLRYGKSYEPLDWWRNPNNLRRQVRTKPQTHLYTKAQKYLHKKNYTFLVYVVDEKNERKEVKDIPHLCDLSWRTPWRSTWDTTCSTSQVRIDLVSGAAPVAKSPYLFASSEMKELSNQL